MLRECGVAFDVCYFYLLLSVLFVIISALLSRFVAYYIHPV